MEPLILGAVALASIWVALAATQGVLGLVLYVMMRVSGSERVAPTRAPAATL